MTWLWVLGCLLTIFTFLLLAPLRLQVTYPTPKLEARWFGIAFDLYYQTEDMQMKLVLWGYHFKFKATEEEEKPIKEKKSKKKRSPKGTPKKWRANNITWPFLKDLWKNPALPALFKHCRKFFVRFWKSAKLEKAHVEYCLEDVVANGVLFPIATWFPLPNRVHLEPNFTRQNTLNLVLKVSLWRILKAVVIFLIFFPYKKTKRLYNSVRRVLRT